MCPIERHQYRWLWVTLNVTLTVWNLSSSHSSVISTMCVCMTRKESVSFNPRYLSKMTDFSRLKTVTYTVNVAVYQKWCKIDTLLLHTTNRKCHVAYRFRAISNDLEWPKGHSPIAKLLKCNSANICATFRRVSNDTARRAVPRRQLSFLLTVQRPRQTW